MVGNLVYYSKMDKSQIDRAIYLWSSGARDIWRTNSAVWRAMVTLEMSGILSAAMKRFVDGEQRGSHEIRPIEQEKPARIGTVVASRIIRSLRNAIFETVQHARIHSINETGFQLIRIDPRYRDRFARNRAIFVNVRGLKCLLNLFERVGGGQDFLIMGLFEINYSRKLKFRRIFRSSILILKIIK